jgi:site-specific DNA-methyltransferase (adenine-specific)
MTPYYDDGTCTIYHGNALELFPLVEFDCVVTDPPYGISYRQTIASVRDYGEIAGDHDDTLARWILNATTKPRIVFGINHFPTALPEPGRWICWDKRLVPEADKMLGSPFELAWMSGPDKAGIMIRIQHGGVVNADGVNRKRVHPTQKPLSLLTHILEAHTKGVVLDPFMGSGTTLRAAKDLGRKAVGIEIEERYCELAAERLAQDVLPFGVD